MEENIRELSEALLLMGARLDGLYEEVVELRKRVSDIEEDGALLIQCHGAVTRRIEKLEEGHVPRDL
jgi:hypothetical protein